MEGAHTGAQEVSHRAIGKGFGMEEGGTIFSLFLPHRKHLGFRAVHSDSVLDESRGSKAENIFFGMAALPVTQC